MGTRILGLANKEFTVSQTKNSRISLKGQYVSLDLVNGTKLCWDMEID